MAGDGAGLRARWEPFAAASFPVLLLLPFLNKAYHIDDTLTLWTAKHILTDPVRFFDYTLNWTGVEGKAYLIIKNPPLSMYYAALVGAVFGFGEIALHAAFLVPAAIVGVETYRVSARFCTRPLLASFATVLTPAVLISSSNVMTTVSMLALFLVAIDLWLIGLERGRAVYYFVSAAAISASALTQYFGASLVPLLLVYTALRARRAGVWLVALSIPIATLVAYDVFTRSVFGYGMLFEAGSYAREFRGQEAQAPWLKLVLGALFMGGCVWTGLWFLPLMGRIAQLGAMIAAAAGFALSWALYTTLVSEGVGEDAAISKISLSTHAAVFVASATLVVGFAIYDLYKTRSPDSLMLFLWITGTFVFASSLNWTANGRSLLGMCPPAAILIVRELDRRKVWADWRRRMAWTTLAPMAVGCLVLVYADFTFANSARAAAKYMLNDLPMGAGRRIYFGHWGFQYYMDLGGAEHVDLLGTNVGPGDAVIMPTNNMRQMDVTDIHSYEMPVAFDVFPWASTFDFRTGAGFYASSWGPLPYVIGRAADETYLAVLADRAATLHDPRLDPETGLPIDP